jgi:hypothetical protein
MGRLLYSVSASLDGYTADAAGSFDWAAPTDDVHAFINERERAVGTYLFGRRMYETMRAWDALPGPGDPAVVAGFAEVWTSCGRWSRDPIGTCPSAARRWPRPPSVPG